MSQIITESSVATTTENTVKRDFAPHRRASARICKTCGKFYIISDPDVIYYVKNYGTMPLRCGECRAKNRTQETTDSVMQ